MLDLIFREGQRWAEVLGIAFVNTAIVSAAVTALGCCAMRLRGWNASSRYCAWWLVLALLIVLPVIQIANRRSDSPGNPVASIVRYHQRSYSIAAQTLPLPEIAAPVSPRREAVRRFTVLPSGNTLFLLCCCVVLLQMCRLTWGLFASLRLKRSGAISTDACLLAAFNRAAGPVNTRRRVFLAISHSVTSPVMIGYLRPGVLLPERLIRQLQPEELEQVLSHELAHAARYDDWAIAFQRLVQAIFFFHPLLQFVCWRIDANREIACDDRVIATVQPAGYAACLTKIAELSGFGPRLAGTLPLLSRKSNLAVRVETILDRTRSHVPRFSVRRVCCFAVLGIVACGIGLRGPVVMAYPVNTQQQIAIPSTFVSAPAHIAEQPTAPAPQQNRVAAAKPAVKPSGDASSSDAISSHSISSIEVTSQDGSTSTFNVDGGSDRHANSALPPGTIVFRRDGHSYIIRDPSIIAGAEELVRPLDELAHAQIDLGREQERMSEAQKRLNEQMQRSVQPSLDLQAMKQLSELDARAAEQLRSLDINKDWEKVAEEQRKKMQALTAGIQARLAQEQGQFGRLQGKLNGELGQLQQRLGALDRLQGNFFEHRTEENGVRQKKLRDLIERAEKQGLAKPLP